MSRETAISEGGLITAHVISPSILAACWSASWKVSYLKFVNLSLVRLS